ncbi:3-mercaptopyruvate sulfurtransferase [uncultured Brevundimonas sp.]|uniref:3-mercaptopyruvate sulfurtransferase n=1 Tax=uncultured Brevundimonas sp. TaxID=213418 RepID=UPI00262EFAAA|nr:3-mercaptopyruvate sulfurtransferase [uncultured Brevundimonas sp.]
MTRSISPVITAAELAAIIDNDDLRIVDASWWMDNRDARADFEKAHIPGAVFIDIDDVSDETSPLPHTLPQAAAFAATVGAAGIGRDDHIVVYDTQGLFSAARMWWLFRVFGAHRVQVLDGGLPKWQADGHPVETGKAHPRDGVSFDPSFNAEAVADINDVLAALGTDTQIIDARSAPRFNAQVPEPRAGVRGGHMPGALNLPFGNLLNADGTIKGGSALEAAFKEIGVEFDRPVITSCGSGVTAAILTLGLELLGKPSRLYDGSWTEWGSREDTPIEP